MAFELSCTCGANLRGATRKKPYTAITVQVERLTGDQYEENDFSGIVDLIEVIRLQSSGPTEAARAIRKKLKYGSVHRQLRALTILDGLIQNAGSRFQRAFADEPLLERLRVAATDPVSDAEVREKCKVLFGQWAGAYKNTPGMERLAALYRQLPQRKKPRPQQQSKVLRETEADAENESARISPPVSSPSTTTPSTSRPRGFSTDSSFTGSSKKPTTVLKSSKKDKRRGKPFNLEKEKPQLMETIASASLASINLMNALKLINRENMRVSEDPEVTKRFEACKTLRRQVLRYIQHVESENWLGSLIHANDELVNALMAYEVLDQNVEEDSDSEDDDWDVDDNASRTAIKSPAPDLSASEAFAGLRIENGLAPAKPPRQGMSMPMPPPLYGNGKGKAVDEGEEGEEEEEDDDENDPFADRNAVNTPHVEAPGMTWREV
ncbi:MAG: putative actin patch assembly and actin polymerization protein [Sclerophora amabilis]|nr:MAG: putative actin patch assembly and actin polymerization protein [Sclerophora amabilis]